MLFCFCELLVLYFHAEISSTWSQEHTEEEIKIMFCLQAWLIDRNRYCKLSTIQQLRRDPCFLHFAPVTLCNISQRQVFLTQPCSFPVKITNEHKRQQSTQRSFSPWNRISLVSCYWMIMIFPVFAGKWAKVTDHRKKSDSYPWTKLSGTILAVWEYFI